MTTENRKILIVDDEPLIGESLQEALKKWDFDVTLIQESDKAIRELNHGYDMVLTDIRMPKVSGMEILQKVKEISPATGVIMITAYGTVEQAVDAMKIGAFDYLMKPFDFDEIKHSLNDFFRLRDWQEGKNNGHSNGNQTILSDDFVGKHDNLRDIFEVLEIAAQCDAPVFIQSESGTGKELIASKIHDNSDRKEKPYLKINCAALPENLIESQLFGHEKGAFTGAVKTFKGLFEEARNGTLLLDEITEMPQHLQAKLLRVLQDGEFTRLGSNQPMQTNARIIATSNRDVATAIDAGEFRQDLFFRLNVISITIPPLRERQSDIPLLANYFIQKYCNRYSKNVTGIEPEVLDEFYQYQWPGNVREFENVIHRCVLACKNNQAIALKHLSKVWFIDDQEKNNDALPRRDMSLDEMEKQLITSTLERHNYHKTRTAEILGVTLKTLRKKMLLYGLEQE